MMIETKEMQQFKETFDNLTRKHDPNKIYEAFLDYAIQENSNEQLFDMKPDSTWTADEILDFQRLYTLFQILNKETIEEYGWADLCGEIYEDCVIATSRSKKLGSFYTPRQISEVLSDIIGGDNQLAPSAYDPTCGSSRNLLDYWSRHPEVTLVGEYCGTSYAVIGGHIYVTDRDWIMVQEEILGVIGLLSLSDDAFKVLVEKLPIIKADTDGTPVEHGGLDAWIKPK